MKDAAHHHFWQTADVIFGLGLAVAIVFSLVGSIGFPVSRGILIVIGGGLMVVGLAFVVLSKQQLLQGGQSSEPGVPTTKVLSTGIYSRSRNPMYTGVAFVFTGLGLVFNSVWLLIWLLPTLVAAHYILIAPEEAYLEGKFGEEYMAYKRSVRRWL